MCGIYGIVQFDRPLNLARPILDSMAASLAHRGPDGCGRHQDPYATIGNTLLRINDPHSSRNQPFCHEASGVAVVCNGEIYNAAALRARFADYPFKTRSDVEPLLPLFLELGPQAFTDVDGMFACAVWDPRSRSLLLTRDRAGEKPLFFTLQEGRCAFGSEIQALLAIPGLTKRLNASAVNDVLTFGYALKGETLIEGVSSVEPGTIVVFGPHGAPAVHRYWHPWPPEVPPPPRRPEQELDRLLNTAVAKQLTADVPVGVFSSGGVDSALLTALASAHVSPSNLPTFSVGFAEPSYDERRAAAAVAEHLGTPPVQVVATNSDLAAQLHGVVTRCAEPIIDPAVLPTAILAREARKTVGVILSGEGADELFGGYPTYPGHVASQWLGALPHALQWLLTRGLDALPNTDAKVAKRWLAKRLVAEATSPAFARHVAWFGRQLRTSVSERGQHLWDETAGLEPLTRFMAFDYSTYLREGLLPKVDRATMLASLEARAPFLDPEVTRFAFTLPDNLKVRGLRTKVLLKRTAVRYLPRHVVHRRKRGLSVPINQLMRHELRREYDQHLREERFEDWDLLPPGRVGELVSEHRSRRADHGRALWTLLVLGMWTEHWMGV